MVFLICQDYINTTNNHAGIKYLCKWLESNYSLQYKAVIIPCVRIHIPNIPVIGYVLWKWKRNRIEQLINSCRKRVLKILGDDDIVVFMEYLDNPGMLSFAKLIRKRFPNVKLMGMAHLVPQKYDKMFNDQALNEWSQSVDKILTLGHSLTNYFIERGLPADKLATTFHYVDREYYQCDRMETDVSKPLQVIAMGNQMRNMEILERVVKCNPDVNFVICQGMNDLSRIFKGFSNVKLIPFVDEDVLKQLMEESDISLNVMDDTVGSNVIVTSLAMGLAMVCSDVGSIRDYCDDDNCVLCSNEDIKSFSNAIKSFQQDRKKLFKSQSHSLSLAERLEMKAFQNDILKIINE